MQKYDLGNLRYDLGNQLLKSYHLQGFRKPS
jgi:hypothetical protein